MKTFFRVGLVLLLLATTIPIVVANLRQDPSGFAFHWQINQEPALEVKLAPVARARVSRTIEAPGKVEADTEVKISAQVMARITDLPIKEGDVVRKEQLLVQLDPVQFQADVRSIESRILRLKASIAASEADLNKSKRDLDRNQKLISGGAVSTTEVADMQTTYLKGQANLAMCKAELVETEATLVKSKEDVARTTLRSPINGIVSQLLAKEGEVVVVGTMNNAGTVIMSVSDPNTMVVRARVDENNIPLVRVGQQALIHFQNGDTLTLHGTVKRISPKGIKAGATNGTGGNDNDPAIFETIVALESPPPRVRLGMTASVEILVEERDNVVSIPAPCVLHRRARDLPANLAELVQQEGTHSVGVKDPTRRYHQVVFVMEDGKARAKLVKTGISDESRVEILDGLRESEKVIAGPYRVFDKLKDGKPIKELVQSDE
jgi:HlyD family secretion protein